MQVDGLPRQSGGGRLQRGRARVFRAWGWILGVRVSGSGLRIWALISGFQQGIGCNSCGSCGVSAHVCASLSAHNDLQHVPESPKYLPDTTCSSTTKADPDFLWTTIELTSYSLDTLKGNPTVEPYSTLQYSSCSDSAKP